MFQPFSYKYFTAMQTPQCRFLYFQLVSTLYGVVLTNTKHSSWPFRILSMPLGNEASSLCQNVKGQQRSFSSVFSGAALRSLLKTFHINTRLLKLCQPSFSNDCVHSISNDKTTTQNLEKKTEPAQRHHSKYQISCWVSVTQESK